MIFHELNKFQYSPDFLFLAGGLRSRKEISMKSPNFPLKAAAIVSDGTLKNFVLRLNGRPGTEKLTEQRFGRIIHRRTPPTVEEKRAIAWALQKPIKELFPEDDE